MNYAKMFSRLSPHTHPRGRTYEFKQFFKIYKYLNTRVFHSFLAASSTRYLPSVLFFYLFCFILPYLFIYFLRDLFRFCEKRRSYCFCNGARVDFLCMPVCVSTLNSTNNDLIHIKWSLVIYIFLK